MGFGKGLYGFWESDGMKKVGEEGNNVADENKGLNMLRFE